MMRAQVLSPVLEEISGLGRAHLLPQQRSQVGRTIFSSSYHHVPSVKWIEIARATSTDRSLSTSFTSRLAQMRLLPAISLGVHRLSFRISEQGSHSGCEGTGDLVSDGN